MLEKMFETIFKDGILEVQDIFLCLACALIGGLIFASLCFVKTKSTRSFFVATATLPPVVALVILLVNGNLGAGVAIAGAFSLVRFRSAPGTAKEISIIFIAMASGLAFGMGYLGYGLVFLIASGALLLVFEVFKVWDRKPALCEKNVRITLPEDLDYTTIFNDIFEKYAVKYHLVKMKTTNMGSMFRVDYAVTLKNIANEKPMVDEIRTRNGNLEVIVQKTDYNASEL